MLDGSPIICVVTGVKTASKNGKTGKMIQSYIIRKDMLPMQAIWTGNDSAICGDCIHRGDGTGKDRTCYVGVFRAPTDIYKTYHRGRYQSIEDAPNTWEVFTNKAFRFGSYGDPAAVPLTVWANIRSRASKSTGYTHQWKSCDREYSQFLMASADSAQDYMDASDLGYRVFRVASVDTTKVANMVLCPASEQAGKRSNCSSCGLCAGNASKAKSVFIPAHGASKAKVNG